MALITLPKQNRTITDQAQVGQFLLTYNIHHERWPLPDFAGPDATPDAILAAYATQIQTLKTRGGYVTADVINVNPQTPNLDAILAKFSREHTHAEDEVRFILSGRGVFHINPDRPGHEVFAIQTDPGDLINVPAGTRHWFDLCAEKTIRAIRLFKDPSGWTPEYLPTGLHGEFVPVCFSIQQFSGEPQVVNRLPI
jgi:1,2-dihydroxy-3-keto-5-methylthiopentene dioxygenase